MSKEFDDVHARSYQFQIAQTGSTNEIIIEIPNGETIQADSIIPSEGYLQEAKYIRDPDNSPFISESNAPDFVREKVYQDLNDEFRRYALAINSPETPLRGLEVIVSDQRAVEYFENLMTKYNIPGRVIGPDDR